MDDARRVEAAHDAFQEHVGWRGNRYHLEPALRDAIAAADEAVGGVVPRETADKLAEALEAIRKVAAGAWSQKRDCTVEVFGDIASMAETSLAAYRRDAA